MLLRFRRAVIHVNSSPQRMIKYAGYFAWRLLKLEAYIIRTNWA